MSRLGTLTPETIKQLIHPDADADLIILLTLYDLDEVTPRVRFTNNYLTRISETDEDVLYGVVSRGDSFTFLPLKVTPPTEERDSTQRASLTIEDVTRYITPVIRTLNYPPRVKMELVLSKTPDIVEVTFDDLYITNFSYNAKQVTADLSALEMDREPFPAYSFTPQFNAGLF